MNEGKAKLFRNSDFFPISLYIYLIGIRKIYPLFRPNFPTSEYFFRIPILISEDFSDYRIGIRNFLPKLDFYQKSHLAIDSEFFSDSDSEFGIFFPISEFCSEFSSENFHPFALRFFQPGLSYKYA